ncbi:MAG: hypothetical protein LBP59_02680 [Planctomycetaceae bacterium]|nr:hypothetical protein [Planctomycetaceae bacterium]
MPVFLQIRRRNACIPGSQASRLHFRIAGVSPACGCTQPLMIDVKISSVFLFAFRQSAGGTPAIRWSRMPFGIAGEFISQPLMSDVKISSVFLFAFWQSAGGTPAILRSNLWTIPNFEFCILNLKIVLFL